MTVRVSVVQRRTDCSDIDWRFDNLNESHHSVSQKSQAQRLGFDHFICLLPVEIFNLVMFNLTYLFMTFKQVWPH